MSCPPTHRLHLRGSMPLPRSDACLRVGQNAEDKDMTLHRRDLLLSSGGAAAAMAFAAKAHAQPADQAPAADLSAYEALDREERINVINLRDIEAEARKILPPESFAYIAGGAGDEWTDRKSTRL